MPAWNPRFQAGLLLLDAHRNTRAKNFLKVVVIFYNLTLQSKIINIYGTSFMGDPV